MTTRTGPPYFSVRELFPHLDDAQVCELANRRSRLMAEQWGDPYEEMEMALLERMEAGE